MCVVCVHVLQRDVWQEISPAHQVTDHVPTSKSKKTKRISRNEDYWTSQASINQLVCPICRCHSH